MFMRSGLLAILNTIHSDILEAMNSAHNYYVKQAVIFRFLSSFTRLIAFSLTVAAIWLTFSKKEYALVKELFGNSANGSLFFIAATGSLIAMDKLYIISSNWKRFTIAKLEIDELRQLTLLNRKRLEVSFTEAGMNFEAFISACEFYERQIVKLFKLQKEETKEWGKDLSSAMDSLKEILDETKKEAEKEAKKKAKPQDTKDTCVVKVSIANHSVIKGEILIILGHIEYSRTPSKVLVFPNVQIKNNHVHAKLIWTTGDESELFAEDVVSAEAGELAEIEFDVSS